MKQIPNKIRNIIDEFIKGVDEIVKYRSDIYGVAYDIEFDNNFDVTISPLVKNIDKFNYWLEALPFYMNVQREGVVLNES